MERRPVGRTELSVSVLGFGGAEIPAPWLVAASQPLGLVIAVRAVAEVDESGRSNDLASPGITDSGDSSTAPAVWINSRSAKRTVSSAVERHVYTVFQEHFRQFRFLPMTVRQNRVLIGKIGPRSAVNHVISHPPQKETAVSDLSDNDLTSNFRAMRYKPRHRGGRRSGSGG
jgi:hypothetical protein